jgi:hypothetical protein
MKKGHQYTYVMLRYRHDPLAGEFANVGVVLHAPAAGFLSARMRHTAGRLSKIFPDVDSEVIKGAFRSVERSINRIAEKEGNDLLSKTHNAETFAARVLRRDDSSFVWGPLGSGVTDNPEKTLETLYARFVGRYDDRQRLQRDDAAVWKPVRDLLLQRNLAHKLQPKIISSAVDKVEFAHAWKNGAWHCYQPLSFDLATSETIKDKAKRWAGQMLALQHADEPFKPHFVVGAPSEPALHDAFETAVKILKLSPVDAEIIDESDVATLVNRIEDQLRNDA